MGSLAGEEIVPGKFALAVSKSDTVDLVRKTRGIYLGTTGDVSVVMAGDGATVVFPSMAAGVIHPLEVTRINSTNTTASGFVVIW